MTAHAVCFAESLPAATDSEAESSTARPEADSEVRQGKQQYVGRVHLLVEQK